MSFHAIANSLSINCLHLNCSDEGCRKSVTIIFDDKITVNSKRLQRLMIRENRPDFCRSITGKAKTAFDFLSIYYPMQFRQQHLIVIPSEKSFLRYFLLSNQMKKERFSTFGISRCFTLKLCKQTIQRHVTTSENTLNFGALAKRIRRGAWLMCCQQKWPLDRFQKTISIFYPDAIKLASSPLSFAVSEFLCTSQLTLRYLNFRD